MNHTRSRLVCAARRMISAVVMSAVLAGAAHLASASEHGESPYVGEPVLKSAKPVPAGKPLAPGAPTLRVGGQEGNSADLSPYFQVPGGGNGIEASIGHIAGETVGREESLTHINLQPYMFVEQNMFLSDLRMYRLNEGGQGFNVGLGMRRYFEQYDTIFGAIAYYDIDKTRRQQFQQLGLSLEMLTRWWDLRANWYIPTGDTEQILGTGFVDGSQHFQENFLLVDTTTLFGDAAEGLDVTGTIPIPWGMLQPYNVEASAGFYHFQVRDKDLPNLWGYRLRADASFFERMLHTYVELTHDDENDTNVIFGASLDYYGGFENRNRFKDRQYYRMSEFVRRNYNVVTIQSTVINEDVPVLDPQDNQPYFFVHIDNTDDPDLNDGTFENPFDSITQAFAEAELTAFQEDVFLVHGGSTFTGDEATLVVPENSILLGENVPGRPQTLQAVGLGPLELPVANPDAGPVILTGSSGTTIDATNARLVGALTIVDPGLHGLLVDGPSGLAIPQLFRDLDIQGADGDGVLFDNASGNFTLERVTVQADDGIDGASGVAFHVMGGNATITALDVDSDVIDDPTFENSGGNPNEVILIENIAGGSVNLTETTANDTGGGGIRLLNNGGNISLGAAVLDDIGQSANPVGQQAAVEVFGGTGNVTFFGDIAVTNAQGVGFLVDSLEETGRINVTSGTDISINARNNVGAEFRNVMGSVQFSPTLATTSGSTLTIGALDVATNTDAPAVWFNSSSGSVSLNQVTIFNSNTDGILIGTNLDGVNDLAEQNVATVDPDTGAVTRPMFITTGTTTINATGNAANPGFAAIRIQGVDFDPELNPFGEAADVNFRNTVLINTRADRGIQIENTSGRIQFSGTTTVNNNAQLPSDRAALFIDDSISTISFGTFIANDTISGEAAVEITDMPLPGSVGFNEIQINDAIGDGAGGVAGLFVNRVSSLNIGEGTIDVEDGVAVHLENVYPQDEAGNWIVVDNQNRLVLLNGPNVPNPTLLNPVAVLDLDGNPLLDDMGNPVPVPAISTLRPFAGYNVNLTRVDAVANSLGTAQPVGIFLQNNVGTFQITGVAGAPGSGGQILGPGFNLANSSVGFFANNADRVILRNQDYTSNDIGLIFQNMNGNNQQGFLLDSLRVQDSIQEAVLASDVRNITIVDSIFQNSGFVDLVPGDDELFRDTILIEVNRRPDDPFDPNDDENPLLFPYTYNIVRNMFLDQNSTVGSDAVRIQTAGGVAQGSLLTLFFEDNEFAFDRGIDGNDTPKLLNVIWNGTIDALIRGNTANFAIRDRPRGFEIRQTSAADNQSQVVVTENTLNFNDSPGAIGALFDFIGRARIDLTDNTFDMGGGGNSQTAAVFRLFAEGNDVEISNNIFEFQTIAFQQGSGIGVDVQQVFGGTVPSSFTINGNVIGSTDQLAANTAFRFQQTVGQVNLFGNVNNSVFANNLFLPTANPDIVGTIIINGQNLP